MKMNVIKFAELIGYISGVIVRQPVSEGQIQDIRSIIDEGLVPEERSVPVKDVELALMNIQTLWLNGAKIEAIKVTREITGMGLKEAKDWCERWPAKIPMPPIAEI